MDGKLHKFRTSVVMATYNGEKFIEKQMESFRTQTLMPDEVIICDDCSDDRTCTIINEYLSKFALHNWKLYKNEKNLGYYENFFEGIRKATGDIIFLADQDDIWDRRKIETIAQIYSTDEKISMVQSYYNFIDENDKELEIAHRYHGLNGDIGVKEIETKNMCNAPGAGFTMSFRSIVSKTIFEHDFNKNKWVFSFHDILIGLVSAALGKCMLCTDIKDGHRLHTNNATQRIGQKYVLGRTRQDQITILKRRVKEFEITKKVCSDKEKREVFEKFQDFNKCRNMLVERRKFYIVLKLFAMKELYASKLGIITDIMYALGLEKLQMFLYKKMNRK